MKTITYNPETHALVPREPSGEMCDAATADSCWENMNPPPSTAYRLMIAAAPQPEPNRNWCAGCSPDNCSGCGAEPVDVGSVGWKHDCAALCANDIELWIDRCPHCGKPRHNHPPTDDELLNKAEQVDSEPAMWVMKHIRSGDLAQAKPNQKALHPYMWSQAHLYTTPQPDRVAELEAALKVARDGIDEFLVANDPTEFGCACDLSVGYLCGPCHADKQQQPLKSALAKINEVLHD